MEPGTILMLFEWRWMAASSYAMLAILLAIELMSTPLFGPTIPLVTSERLSTRPETALRRFSETVMEVMFKVAIKFEGLTLKIGRRTESIVSD